METLNVSLVNAAAYITGEGKRVKDARLAIGAVAPTIVLANATGSLIGASMRGIASRIQGVSEKAAEESRPITDQRASARYRKAMVATASMRALSTALERAREGVE